MHRCVRRTRRAQTKAKKDRDTSGEEGTDASGEEGTDGWDREDLLKIDVSRGGGGLVGHRIRVTVLPLAVIFIHEDNFCGYIFLAILSLLAKFAKISTC